MYRSDGQEVHAHSGGVPGFATYIVRYLGDDLSLIVLTNLEEADPERIARRVAGVLRDDLRTPDRHPIADSRACASRRPGAAAGASASGHLTAVGPAARARRLPAQQRDGLSLQFEGLGELHSLTLVARDPLGDDEHSQYLAIFASGPPPRGLHRRQPRRHRRS